MCVCVCVVVVVQTPHSHLVPQGLGLWDQLPCDQAHCKRKRKSRRQRRNASGESPGGGHLCRRADLDLSSQELPLSPPAPNWAFWRRWWAMGHRGRLHPICPGPQALQGLAQGGTLIGLNSCRAWESVGYWGPQIWARKGSGVTSSSPSAQATLPASSPHQAFLFAAWGPDQVPQDQGGNSVSPCPGLKGWWQPRGTWFLPSQPWGSGGQGGPSQSSFWRKS